MDNQDNLFNKIKTAAENAETKDFSSMEKVWSRIDAKLDTKVEKKHNNNFRKLFIAASVLIVFGIGYQFFKTEKSIETPNHEVVNKGIIKTIVQDSLAIEKAIVSTEIKHPEIKKNAAEILKKQIEKPQSEAVSVVVYDEIEKSTEVVSLNDSKENDDNTTTSNDKKAYENSTKTRSTAEFYELKREAKSVAEESTRRQKSSKLAPIVIVDGVVSKKTAIDLKDDENVETILELPNPIYYVNGILFTEEALFGPNPTSPYAPLKKQNIETTTVLNPEKAMKIYGDKGKNGVVIITTKDGKPAEKTKE